MTPLVCSLSLCRTWNAGSSLVHVDCSCGSSTNGFPYRPEASQWARSECWNAYIGGGQRATTNVQNGLVSLFLFSFILFRLFEQKQYSEKVSENVWKSAKKCRDDFGL